MTDYGSRVLFAPGLLLAVVVLPSAFGGRAGHVQNARPCCGIRITDDCDSTCCDTSQKEGKETNPAYLLRLPNIRRAVCFSLTLATIRLQKSGNIVTMRSIIPQVEKQLVFLLDAAGNDLYFTFLMWENEGTNAPQPDHSLHTGEEDCIIAQSPDPKCFDQSGAIESTSQVLVETVSMRYVVIWRKGPSGPSKPLETDVLQSARSSIHFCASSLKVFRHKEQDQLYQAMTSCVEAHLNIAMDVYPIVLAAPLDVHSEIATEGYMFVSPAYVQEDVSSKWWQRKKKPLPAVTVVVVLPDV